MLNYCISRPSQGGLSIFERDKRLKIEPFGNRDSRMASLSDPRMDLISVSLDHLPGIDGAAPDGAPGNATGAVEPAVGTDPGKPARGACFMEDASPGAG